MKTDGPLIYIFSPKPPRGSICFQLASTLPTLLEYNISLAINFNELISHLKRKHGRDFSCEFRQCVTPEIMHYVFMIDNHRRHPYISTMLQGRTVFSSRRCDLIPILSHLRRNVLVEIFQGAVAVLNRIGITILSSSTYLLRHHTTSIVPLSWNYPLVGTFRPLRLWTLPTATFGRKTLFSFSSLSRNPRLIHLQFHLPFSSYTTNFLLESTIQSSRL